MIARKTKKLRVLGTYVTLQEPIRQQAMKDLGIEIEFEAMDTPLAAQKASLHPEAFDVYEQWADSIHMLWRAGTLRQIDISRLRHWESVSPLTKVGRIQPHAPVGAGDAPNKHLYVQKDNTLSSQTSDCLSFVPTIHNVDSFAYNSDLIQHPPEEESWGWLLDPDHAGLSSVINSPTIGLFDLAMAAQSRNLIQFKNIGDMTKPEIDKLFDLLIDFKRQGQFSGFWTTMSESMSFMRSGRMALGTMFAPAVETLKSEDMNIRYAAPKDGYRAWHGVLGLSSEAHQLDAAYAYINWWLSGWPGSFLSRQGFYAPTPEQSRNYLTGPEWDYWYAGQPARETIYDNNRIPKVQAGERRSGGSYEQQFGNVVVWNSVMRNYDYTIRKWYEFITA